MKKLLSGMVLLVVFSPIAKAGIIAEYDFSNVANGSTSHSAATVAPGYTVSSLSMVGVSPRTFSNHFYASGWNTSFNPGKYYSLTINSTSTSILDRLVFSMESTGNFGASDSLRIATSLDGFGSSIFEGGFTTATTTAPAGDSGPVFDFDLDLTGLASSLAFNTMELRFYVASPFTSGFANHDCEPSGAGCGALDVGNDLFLYAHTAAVPEPGTLALMGLGLLGMTRLRRKAK